MVRLAASCHNSKALHCCDQFIDKSSPLVKQGHAHCPFAAKQGLLATSTLPVTVLFPPKAFLFGTDLFAGVL